MGRHAARKKHFRHRVGALLHYNCCYVVGSTTCSVKESTENNWSRFVNQTKNARGEGSHKQSSMHGVEGRQGVSLHSGPLVGQGKRDTGKQVAAPAWDAIQG